MADNSEGEAALGEKPKGLIDKIGAQIDAGRRWLDANVRWQLFESWSGLSLYLALMVSFASIVVMAVEPFSAQISALWPAKPGTPKLEFGSSHWIIFSATAFGGVILSQFFRAWRAQKKFRLEISDAQTEEEEERVRKPSERLDFAILQTLMLSIVVFFAAYPAWSPVTRFGTSPEVQATILAAAALVSLFPIIFLNMISAKHEVKHKQLDRPVIRTNSISAGTFWASFAALLFIIFVAWVASTTTGKVLTNDYAGLGILGGVLTFCAIVILYPHVVNQMDRVSEWSRGSARAGISIPAVFIDGPAMGASVIDSVMVRHLTPAMGATVKGILPPHVVIIVTLLLLGVLGAILKPPAGLVPLVLAMILTLSTGRRWTWINDDCETATRLEDTKSKSINIGFKNDLRDEALLGYSSLFLLVPLALYQLNGWAGGFEETSEAASSAQMGWLMFFGAELAKAVPIVDWWEIYRIDIDTGYEAKNDLGRHLTFAARAIVDLVIMAAVLQAISVSVRRRTQKSLFKDGEVSVLDPFQERHFFRHGVTVYLDEETWNERRNQMAAVRQRQYGDKVRDYHFFGQKIDLFQKLKLEGTSLYIELKERGFIDLLSEHCAALGDSNVSRTPYSAARLSQLQNDGERDVRVGARWLIEACDVPVGRPAEKLQHLHRRWMKRGFEIFYLTVQASDDGKASYKVVSNVSRARQLDRRELWRDEKEDFEAILMELLKSYAPRQAGETELLVESASIADCLRDMIPLVRHRFEFDYSIYLAIELLEKVGNKFCKEALLDFVADPTNLRVIPLEQELSAAESRPVLLVTRLSREELRTEATEALTRLSEINPPF